MAAFTFLAGKRKDQENRTRFALDMLVAHGDDKAVKAQSDEWEKEL